MAERKKIGRRAALFLGTALLVAACTPSGQEAGESENNLKLDLDQFDIDAQTTITPWDGKALEIDPEKELKIAVSSDTSDEGTLRVLSANWKGLTGQIVLPTTESPQAYKVSVSGMYYIISDLFKRISRLNKTFGIVVGENGIGLFQESPDK